jgi:hypothetical protein
MTWTLSEALHSLGKKRAYEQVRIATNDELGDFRPTINDCHGNAARWVAQHPHHRIVPGFLVVNECLFNKHSVVDTGSDLLDITQRPNDSGTLLNFISVTNLFETMPNQSL